MSFRPVAFTWDEKAEVMRLAPRFRRVAREQFRDSEEYPMEVREHRSSKSHAFMFASINDAWDHLSDANKEILQTPEHLRKWALINVGWYDETLIDAGENEPGRKRAMQMAVFARRLDDFAEIKVIKHEGSWFLRIREAKSQSRASMNKEDFEKSKRDVLDMLAGQIDVTRKQLEDAGKRSAV